MTTTYLIFSHLVCVCGMCSIYMNVKIFNLPILYSVQKRNIRKNETGTGEGLIEVEAMCICVPRIPNETTLWCLLKEILRRREKKGKQAHHPSHNAICNVELLIYKIP